LKINGSEYIICADCGELVLKAEAVNGVVCKDCAKAEDFCYGLSEANYGFVDDYKVEGGVCIPIIAQCSEYVMYADGEIYWFEADEYAELTSGWEDYIYDDGFMRYLEKRGKWDSYDREVRNAKAACLSANMAVRRK